MNELRAAVINETGSPEQVIQVEARGIPEPGSGEALLRMHYAPINPADLNFIEGTYGKQPDLPCVPGTEGVGEVLELGAAVEHLQPGDIVILPAGTGSWRSHLVANADSLIKVPADADHKQLAMLRVNPATAYRMLHDFVDLAPGDWIIQNAANSGVGTAVIRIARSLGWRTVNVVRREELIEPLKAAGADVVITDSREDFKSVAGLTDNAGIRLGLNAVGGDNAFGVAACLAPGGVHVTYGAMGREALKLPNSFLIFRDLHFCGFWVTRWFEQASAAASMTMFETLGRMVRDGELEVEIAAEYTLDEVAEALQHAQQGQRGGKVLLKLS